MSSRVFRLLYFQGVEMIFGGLLLVAYYFAVKQQAPIIPYLCVYILGSFLFVLSIEKFDQKGKVLYFFIGIPFNTAFGHIIGIPVPLVLVISFVLFLHVYYHTIKI